MSATPPKKDSVNTSSSTVRRHAFWPIRAVVRLYRLARGLLALGMLVQLVLICTPITERLSLGLTVSQPPVHADVLVCLGGDDSRLLNSATLYHHRVAPKVIVSNQPGAAQRMRNILVMCGVPEDIILVDDTSYVTSDHPAGVTRLPGIDPKTQRFLIVTSRHHSRRAAACFRHAGFQHFTIFSGPTPAFDETSFYKLARYRVQVMPRLLYEYTGLLQYWLQGRI